MSEVRVNRVLWSFSIGRYTFNIMRYNAVEETEVKIALSEMFDNMDEDD